MSTLSHPLSDRAVSWLRTAIPVLWGTVVAAILRATTPHLPGDLGTALATWLSSETTLALVTATAIAAWYALWRWAEPRIPGWLTRLVLGSARPPSYAPVAPDGAHVITTLADSTPLPSVVDVSAPQGYEVPEVSAAKDEVAEAVRDLLDYHIDDVETVYTTPRDPIHEADTIVEKLLELGWRPTTPR